jgi:hypothetical protein
MVNLHHSIPLGSDSAAPGLLSGGLTLGLQLLLATQTPSRRAVLYTRTTALIQTKVRLYQPKFGERGHFYIANHHMV